MGIVLGLVRAVFRSLRGGQRLVGKLSDGQAFAKLQGGFKGVGKAGAEIGADHEAVNHHVDVMLEFLVQRRHAVNLIEMAIDLDALEAFFLELGKFLAVFAFAAAHDGGEDIKPLAFGKAQDLVYHHRHRLAFDGQARGGGIGNADAGKEQAHVVINFGDGAHSGTRIAAGGFLLDGNGGREAIDLVHVRLLHHFEELAGIGRE